MARRSSIRVRRKGTATVELAICLPLLLTIVFGSIQACRWIHVREALHVASYEGGRALTQKGVSIQEAEQRAKQLLQDRGVEGASIKFSPPVADLLPSGVEFSITVSAPMSPNAMYSFGQQEITVNATFVRED